MKRFLFLISFIALVGAQVVAQEETTISADRPGMSTGTDVMGAGKIQWETGVGFQRAAGTDSYTLNNTLFRYGATDRVEVRVGMDLLYESGTVGVTGLNIGTKIRVSDNEGWRPAISLMANLQSSRLGSAAYCPEHLAPQMYLLFQNQLSERFSLGYNLGAEWDGTVSEPTTFAALCLGFALTDNLGCFVESYNYFHSSNNEYSVDFGMNWVVSRRVQLDWAANINLQSPQNNFMVSAGVAWLIN